eukprot:2889366-Rhodomonas_salina.1
MISILSVTTSTTKYYRYSGWSCRGTTGRKATPPVPVLLMPLPLLVVVVPGTRQFTVEPLSEA